MNVRYSLAFWEFDIKAWNAAMLKASLEMGEDFVAAVLGVSPKTVHTWTVTDSSSYSKFPHPSMTNFIKACNELDLDPRKFFILEE